MPLAAPTVVVKTLPVVIHQGGSGTSTTVLAMAGLVLALASIAWQAWSFRLSGSRVSVALRAGMRNASGSVVTAPAELTTAGMQLLQRQGFTQPALVVEVTNSGRSPTNVLSVKILYDNGAAYAETHYTPPLPCRVDAESEQTWYFDGTQISVYGQAMGQVLTSDKPLGIRGQVTIGGKKKPVVSKNRFAL